MTAIPTATGTVDSAELGRVLVHEHVFVLGEEFRQNVRRLGRGRPCRRRRRPTERVEIPRHRHHPRPDRARAGPLSAAHPEDRGQNGFADHRRHRHLHLQRCALSIPLHRAGFAVRPARADGGDGLDVLLPFEDRIDTIVELVRRGYLDKVVIAHDAACHIDWFDPVAKAQVAPKWNYRHISADVIPALIARGLTEDDIDAILVRNPRRYFEK